MFLIESSSSISVMLMVQVHQAAATFLGFYDDARFLEDVLLNYFISNFNFTETFFCSHSKMKFGE